MSCCFFYRDRLFKLHDGKQISVEKNKPVRRDESRVVGNTGLYTTSILLYILCNSVWKSVSFISTEKYRAVTAVTPITSRFLSCRQGRL